MDESGNQIVANGGWKKVSEIERVEKHIPKLHLLLHVLLFIVLCVLYFLASKLFGYDFFEKSAVIFAIALFVIHGLTGYVFSRECKVKETFDEREISNPDYDPHNLY